jgi:hypothetical protein
VANQRLEEGVVVWVLANVMANLALPHAAHPDYRDGFRPAA